MQKKFFTIIAIKCDISTHISRNIIISVGNTELMVVCLWYSQNNDFYLIESKTKA